MSAFGGSEGGRTLALAGYVLGVGGLGAARAAGMEGWVGPSVGFNQQREMHAPTNGSIQDTATCRNNVHSTHQPTWMHAPTDTFSGRHPGNCNMLPHASAHLDAGHNCAAQRCTGCSLCRHALAAAGQEGVPQRLFCTGPLQQTAGQSTGAQQAAVWCCSSYMPHCRTAAGNHVVLRACSDSFRSSAFMN